MWNYPDGMRESDIPGWNEWDMMMHLKCSNIMDLKFVDPDEIRDFIDSITYLVNKDALAGRTNSYTSMSKAIKDFNDTLENSPTYEVECDFEGEVEAIGDGNTYGWQCPKCGAEREGELPDE